MLEGLLASGIEGGAEVRLSRSAGAEQQDRAASVDPSVAGGERDNVR